jgi:hypothetical protein
MVLKGILQKFVGKIQDSNGQWRALDGPHDRRGTGPAEGCARLTFVCLLFSSVPSPNQQEVKDTPVSQRRALILIYPDGRDFESLSENEYFLFRIFLL